MQFSVVLMVTIVTTGNVSRGKIKGKNQVLCIAIRTLHMLSKSSFDIYVLKLFLELDMLYFHIFTICRKTLPTFFYQINKIIGIRNLRVNVL